MPVSCHIMMTTVMVVVMDTLKSKAIMVILATVLMATAKAMAEGHTIKA